MIKYKILFIVGILFITNIYAQYVVTGESKITGKKLLKRIQRGKKIDIPQNVFTEASNKAYEEAIYKELYSILPRETVNNNSPLIESSIFKSPEAYLSDQLYISEELMGDGTFKITYKVTINRDLLQRDLSSYGLDFGMTSRKSVMLLMDEYFKPDQKPSSSGGIMREEFKTERLDLEVVDKETITSGRNEYTSDSKEKFEDKLDSDSDFKMKKKRERTKLIKEYYPPDLNGFKQKQSSCATEIQKQFLIKDVNVVDKEYTDKIRNEFLGKDGYLAEFLEDDSKIADLARASSEEFNADILVIGCVNIIYNGIDANGIEKTTANLVVKVVDASNGAILGSETNSQSGAGFDAVNSAKTSAKRLGQTIGLSLADQLVSYFKKREDKGYEYTIHLEGMSKTKNKIFFLKVLKKLEMTVSTHERRWDRKNKYLEVVVQYKGNVGEFKEAFFEKIYEIDDFAGLEEEQSKGSTILLKLYD